MPTISDALSIAITSHQAGRTDHAAALYKLILSVDPTHLDATHFFGILHRQRGDRAAAAAWMSRGRRMNATLATRHVDFADTLAELERYQEAADAYRDALRWRPDQPRVFLALGDALNRCGRGDAARNAYRRALALQPDLVSACLALGTIAYEDNSVLSAEANGEAARQFRRAAVLDREHPLAWLNRGVALLTLGALEAARHAYRQALTLDPGAGRILMRLGQILLALGEVEKGRTALLRSATLIPGDPEGAALLDRAESHRRLMRWAGDATVPDGLAVRGTFRNTSGYAHMVRQFVRRFDAAGVRVNLSDVQVSFLNAMSADKRDPYFETFDRPVRAKALLNFVIPSMADPVPGLDSIVFSMIETRGIPPDWLAHSLRHQHVIVPTPSSARAWIDAGFPAERVHLCPLGVDPRPLSSGIVPIAVADSSNRLFSSYRTRIANISDLTQRKNLDGLLRVWLRATGPDDDAALMLKLGKGTPDEGRKIQGLLADAAASAGKPLSAAAPLFLVSGSYSDDEMTSLLAGATHYWSMSHGEGWDLPMTQAGAMGLTLIAPRHSAYTAYLDDEVALMLPSRPSPGRPPYSGLEWWSPDEDEAAHTLTRVIREGARPPRSARDRLATDFTWERAGDRLIEVLRGLGALPNKSAFCNRAGSVKPLPS